MQTEIIMCFYGKCPIKLDGLRWVSCWLILIKDAALKLDAVFMIIEFSFPSGDIKVWTCFGGN